MGPGTGAIGSLQALEAINIIVGLQGKKTVARQSRLTNVCEDGPPSLLVYSALGTPPFRSVKLRKRWESCPACGTEGQKLGTIEDVG